MSRTPETVIDKKAVSNRNWTIGIGVFFWFLAFGAFQNPAGGGFGLVCLLIGGGLFFIASKIKTRWSKNFEASSYSKR